MHPQPTTKAVLPSLINDRAKQSPDSTFASFPSDEETRSRITFSQFAQACHRFARIISPQDVGRQEGAVGIIANCDTILYLTAIAGLVCGGMTVSRT
jgi:long-subunit acyl-CoA synthetase (AMP-forming)